MATESISRQPGFLPRSGAVTRQSGAWEETSAQVFSSSGQLLRDYRSFAGTSIPEEDRFFLSGQVVAISHPLGMPFSRNDIILAAELQLAELRITGPACVYSLKPKDGAWPDPEVIGLKYDGIRTMKDFALMIAAIKYSPDFLSNSQDHEKDIFRVRRDLICQKLAKDLGMDYRKIALYENLL